MAFCHKVPYPWNHRKRFSLLLLYSIKYEKREGLAARLCTHFEENHTKVTLFGNELNRAENQLDDDFVMQLMGDGEGAEGEEGEWVTDSEEEGSDADSDFMGGRSDDEYDEVPELQPFDVSLSLLIYYC